ncbi:hypothetical protein JL722_4286 [Aureococcus anophagefferens]|nr:hypothetical protein JL722_4286 [Aureococcus anophagefferens]
MEPPRLPDMQPPAKKAVVLASLDGRALKLQVAEGEVVVVVGGAAPAPAPAPAARRAGAGRPPPAPRAEPGAPRIRSSRSSCASRAGDHRRAVHAAALARAAFLESTDDDFGRVRRRCGRGASRRFFPEYHLAARLGRFKTVQGFLGRSRQPTTMVLGDVVDAYHDLAALERLAGGCVEINQWNALSSKNFKPLYLDQIEAGGPFDAVLADCEGAFVDVVRDFPELLDRASWVCVEWDQPSNRNWVAEVRPALLRAGLAPLDCGDRRCACDEPRFAPSFRAQGAPTFHEVFVRTGACGARIKRT